MTAEVCCFRGYAWFGYFVVKTGWKGLERQTGISCLSFGLKSLTVLPPKSLVLLVGERHKGGRPFIKPFGRLR